VLDLLHLLLQLMHPVLDFLIRYNRHFRHIWTAGKTNPIEYVEKPTPESREVVLAEKQWDSILASYSEDDPLHDLVVLARARRIIVVSLTSSRLAEGATRRRQTNRLPSSTVVKSGGESRGDGGGSVPPSQWP
jgi:hypothetical protein